MNIVSFYFPLWLTSNKGVPEIVYSLVYSGAILLASLLSPILGIISDLRKSRFFLLILGTLVSVLFTALLGFVSSVKVALLFFFIAHTGYILSLVFYNSMLPDVSKESTPGKICGLGVGLGYLGSIFGLWIASYYEPMGRQAVFLPTALLFLIFSLPLFLLAFLPQNDLNKKAQSIVDKAKYSFDLKKLSQHTRPIKWFFLANFLCGDAVHTVILYMAIYASKVFEMDDASIRTFFILSTLVALISSFVWGEVVSRKGGLKAMKMVLGLWMLVFIIGSLAYQPWHYWLVGSLVGIGLAGTWISSRVLVIELVPKERIGEYYGFYNLTGKSAAILGPLWWGGLLLLLSPLDNLKYRITLASMLLFVVGAFWALKKVQCGTAKSLR